MSEFDRFVDKFRIASDPPDPADAGAYPRFLGETIRSSQKPAAGFPKGKPFIVETELVDGEVLVWYDLNQPIKQQLKAAEKLLLKKAAQIVSVPFRARLIVYRKYLRLLDAKESSATVSQIANEMYSRLDQTDGKRQARTDIKTAERLRDHDFWRIAAAG